MNNVTALRAGGVTGLYRSSGVASQQTGILGEDTAQRMRVPGIPLARQPAEDAGLQVDATGAISADRGAAAESRSARRRRGAQGRFAALNASGFRPAIPASRAKRVMPAMRSPAPCGRQPPRPARGAPRWHWRGCTQAGRLGGAAPRARPGTRHSRWLEVNVTALGMHLDAGALARLGGTNERDM